MVRRLKYNKAKQKFTSTLREVSINNEKLIVTDTNTNFFSTKIIRNIYYLNYFVNIKTISKGTIDVDADVYIKMLDNKKLHLSFVDDTEMNTFLKLIENNHYEN